MKTGYTHIIFLLDRSGSMAGKESDVKGGYDTFIKKQKEHPGAATLTLAWFDTRYDVIYENKNILDVPELTGYEPRGGTALLDAIANTINRVGASLAAMKEEDRPEKVIMLINTDGLENASRLHTPDNIKYMIKHQRDKYSWEFVFMGADQDAVLAATKLGMMRGNALNYSNTSSGIRGMYAAASAGLNSYRSSHQKLCYDFFETPTAGAKEDEKVEIITAKDTTDA